MRIQLNHQLLHGMHKVGDSEGQSVVAVGTTDCKFSGNSSPIEDIPLVVLQRIQAFDEVLAKCEEQLTDEMKHGFAEHMKVGI